MSVSHSQEAFEMLPHSRTRDSSAVNALRGPEPAAAAANNGLSSSEPASAVEYTALNNSDEDESVGGDGLEMAEKHRSAQQQQYTVGLVLLRRLKRIFGVLLSKQTPDRIGICCLALLAGKLLAEIVFYFSGKLPSEFYKVLGDKDLKAFAPLLVKCMLVVVLAGTAKAALSFISGILGVMMRNALTVYTHERYLHAKSFYPLISSGAIDNPDQRITQDIEKLSSTMADVLSELIIAPILIAYYTVKCWSMSGFFGPLSVYLYFLIGALATRCVMPPIIRNVYVQEREEGNFRFHQVRIREFAESIAFYGGEEKERAVADESLGAVVHVQRRLLKKQLWLNFITQLFSYLGSTVSYVIIAIPIFMGVYDNKSGSDLSSIISMNAFVSLYLIFRFTVVIEQAKKLTDIAGFAARIVQLWEELDCLESTDVGSTDVGSTGERRSDGSDGVARVSAQNLTVCTPAGKPLVVGLNLDIDAGSSLIITGANGVGKTSVLRTLCGLWQPARGSVQLPYTDGVLDVFFLPQTPYIVSGSLREQLSYPGSRGNELRVCTDSDLGNLLATVGLSHLVGKISQTADGEQGSAEPSASVYDQHYSVQFWLKTLSPGEQQKMSLARVLFWKPAFAVLDECTSSLDQVAEASLYQALLDNNITLVSVSHRDALFKYHRRHLCLTAQGYTVTDIEC